MNGTRSYNLVEKAWIPVEWIPTTTKHSEPKIGLRTAFKQAHEIRCISHTAPFIEFGIYRILITIALDAYIMNEQRPTIGTMKRMVEIGSFDILIENYLSQNKKRFDLWDDDAPFLQRKPDKDKKAEAVVKMFAAVPSGSNVTHWHHFGEHETVLDESLVAQMLTAISPFNFKVKPEEVRTLAGDPPLYALVLGKNLFETVVLNLPRPNGRITAERERNNGPAWRTPLEDLRKLPKTPTHAQGFTWPVRIVKLENDLNGRGVVKNALYCAAYKKATEKAKAKGENCHDAKYGWRDPNAGIDVSGTKLTHITARPGVPVWRDAIPLFLVASEGEALRGDRRRSRPETVTNALRIMETPQFRVAVYGMRKKSGGGGDVKVEEWFRSVVSFPPEVARDSRLSARAIESFKTAQKIADTVQIAVRMLRAPSEAKKTDRQKTQREEVNALDVFWRSLELALTGIYLSELGHGNNQAESNLAQCLRREARTTFTCLADLQRRTADGLFRVANASNWLERRLAWLLPRSKNKREVEK